jgi:hypothetical protein
MIFLNEDNYSGIFHNFTGGSSEKGLCEIQTLNEL